MACSIFITAARFCPVHRPPCHSCISTRAIHTHQVQCWGIAFLAGHHSQRRNCSLSFGSIHWQCSLYLLNTIDTGITQGPWLQNIGTSVTR